MAELKEITAAVGKLAGEVSFPRYLEKNTGEEAAPSPAVLGLQE